MNEIAAKNLQQLCVKTIHIDEYIEDMFPISPPAIGVATR
jgi:hypothetical protein